MMLKSVLLANGDLLINKRIEKIVENADLIIAVDGGARHALNLSCKIDLWIGDFDSSSQEIQQKFSTVERKIYHRNKDKLDSELAIEEAKARKAEQITILGAFGGRFDHILALVLISMRYSQENLIINLDSGYERAYFLLSQQILELDLTKNQIFSILALDKISGLTIKGAKWPLDCAKLEVGCGLGMSNEALGTVNLSLEQGSALVIVRG